MSGSTSSMRRSSLPTTRGRSLRRLQTERPAAEIASWHLTADQVESASFQEPQGLSSLTSSVLLSVLLSMLLSLPALLSHKSLLPYHRRELLLPFLLHRDHFASPSHTSPYGRGSILLSQATATNHTKCAAHGLTSPTTQTPPPLTTIPPPVTTPHPHTPPTPTTNDLSRIAPRTNLRSPRKAQEKATGARLPSTA